MSMKLNFCSREDKSKNNQNAVSDCGIVCYNSFFKLFLFTSSTESTQLYLNAIRELWGDKVLFSSPEGSVLDHYK